MNNFPDNNIGLVEKFSRQPKGRPWWAFWRGREVIVENKVTRSPRISSGEWQKIIESTSKFYKSQK